MPRQQSRVLSAVGNQFFTLGRRAVWRWTDHMRDNIDVVASDELGQDACDQGAIGIVDLVEVVNLMRPGPGEPFSFRPGAQFEQALPGEKMLADDRHQQSPDRHQTPRVCRALTRRRSMMVCPACTASFVMTCLRFGVWRQGQRTPYTCVSKCSLYHFSRHMCMPPAGCPGFRLSASCAAETPAGKPQSVRRKSMGTFFDGRDQ